MNSDQLERWLRKQGMEIINKKGTGHKIAKNPLTGNKTEFPVHGGSKEIKKGTLLKIKKDLGL